MRGAEQFGIEIVPGDQANPRILQRHAKAGKIHIRRLAYPFAPSSPEAVRTRHSGLPDEARIPPVMPGSVKNSPRIFPIPAMPCKLRRIPQAVTTYWAESLPNLKMVRPARQLSADLRQSGLFTQALKELSSFRIGGFQEVAFTTAGTGRATFPRTTDS
jgi:hypothetical protein